MKKLLGIVVLGLLKYHPIDYGTTRTKLEPREIDNMIAYGRIYKMKKLLGILVLGLLKYHPIDYGTTVTKLLPREIKP